MTALQRLRTIDSGQRTHGEGHQPDVRISIRRSPDWQLREAPLTKIAPALAGPGRQWAGDPSAGIPRPGHHGPEAHRRPLAPRGAGCNVCAFCAGGWPSRSAVLRRRV